MTKVKKKALKVKTVEAKSQSTKSTKTEPTIMSRGDRVIGNLSIEPFNGCWVGFGYESDVREGESLSEAKERVYDEVVETVMKKVEEIQESNK